MIDQIDHQTKSEKWDENDETIYSVHIEESDEEDCNMSIETRS